MANSSIKKNRIKLKVLPLEPWMKNPRGKSVLSFYQEMLPVFFRDGLYLSGLLCWFEVDSHAFRFEPDGFKYSLYDWETKELDNRKIAALVEAKRQKVSTLEQNNILLRWESIRWAKLNHFRAKARINRYRKSLHDKAKK